MNSYARDTCLLRSAIVAFGLFAVTQLEAQTRTILHSFTAIADTVSSNGDGARPAAGLTRSGNVLYGTASHGGASGMGAVFVLNTVNFGFTNLHSFTSVSGPLSTNSDGANPIAGLVLANGKLYGATSGGGNAGFGTIFKLNIDGTGFTNLHSFSPISGALFSNPDGAYPLGDLVLSGSTLYGTAREGGTEGNGAIFAVNIDGTDFTNLHNFSVAYAHPSGYYTNNDGANPFGGLVISGNTVYGTVVYGGRTGQGAVFAVGTDGAGFTNLHTFAALAQDSTGHLTNRDGANPSATLVLAGNLLCGTTQNGGPFGHGTVFALPTTGLSFNQLHSFTGGDGSSPIAALILSGQTLYGTTAYGGGSAVGTLFAVGTNGSGFTNLYNFTPLLSATNRDGANPIGGLALFENSLLGTTYAGGPYGSGTVFGFALGRVGLPLLSVQIFGPDIVLMWPVSTDVYGLQFSTNITLSTGWTNIFPVAVVTGGQNIVTNPIVGQAGYFRLMR